MLRERKDKIAHMLARGDVMNADGVSDTGYAMAVGRYAEIDDYLEMKYEDLKGE